MTARQKKTANAMDTVKFREEIRGILSSFADNQAKTNQRLDDLTHAIVGNTQLGQTGLIPRIEALEINSRDNDLRRAGYANFPAEFETVKTVQAQHEKDLQRLRNWGSLAMLVFTLWSGWRMAIGH